jgi:LmbE family N-acetylglucosaminyl deacetylase
VGWAAAAVVALHTRQPRLAQALGVSGAAYFLGGGRIPHSDPVLVDALKQAFHRARPSSLIQTFSYPR